MSATRRLVTALLALLLSGASFAGQPVKRVSLPGKPAASAPIPRPERPAPGLAETAPSDLPSDAAHGLEVPVPEAPNAEFPTPEAETPASDEGGGGEQAAAQAGQSFDGSGAPRLSLLHADAMDDGQAVAMVVAEALARRPGLEAFRRLQDLSRLHRFTLSRKDEARLRGIAHAPSAKARSALAEAVLQSLAIRWGPSFLRHLWKETQADILRLMPARVPRGLTLSQSAWLAQVGKAAARALPGVTKVEVSAFSLAQGTRMDHWVNAAFWIDPESRTAHLRVNRNLIEYIFSKDGKKRLTEMNLRTPADLIASFVSRMTAPSLALSEPREQRVSEIAHSAAIAPTWRFRILRWQNNLGLLVIPAALWNLTMNHAPYGLLAAPLAGWGLIPLAVAAALAAAVFLLGPKVYGAAIKRGWIAGADKNVVYPLLMHYSWPTLAYMLASLAFVEELMFRKSLLGLLLTRDILVAFSLSAPMALLIGIGLSTLTFALGHAPNFLFSRLTKKQLAGTFAYFIVSGVVFAGIYLCGGLLLAGTAHAAYNTYLVYKAKTRFSELPA